MTECKLLSCTTYYTCALTFFPVKRKIVQLKGTFSFLDLPSKSHFGNLYLNRGLERVNIRVTKPLTAQRKELFLSVEKKNKVIDILMNLVNCLNEVLVFFAFF